MANFIKSLVRAKCLPRALEVCGELQRRRGGPDIITYSVLIKALVDRRDLKRALVLVDDMRTAGHTPDDIILTHLLEGCRHAREHALGKKVFEDAVTSGVQPSDITLVAMLKLHGRCGAHQEAHDLLAGWEAAHGCKPSVIHYTCLIRGCLKGRNYDLAWAAYRLMCAGDVAPDGFTVGTLMPGMVAAQQWDRVLHLAARALEASARGAAAAAAVQHALSEMQAAGLHARAEALGALLRAAGSAAQDGAPRASPAKAVAASTHPVPLLPAIPAGPQ